MSRARIVVLALVLAGAAAWALAGFRQPPASPAHDVIDEASREQLERVLREADGGS